MSLPALLIAAFLAGSALTGPLTWWVQGWRADSAELKRIDKMAQDGRAQAKRMDVAAESFQARQGAAEARETIVTKEVIRVITQPSYLAECLDADGMRILAGDAAASNARRGIAPALPASSATK